MFFFWLKRDLVHHEAILIVFIGMNAVVNLSKLLKIELNVAIT